MPAQPPQRPGSGPVAKPGEGSHPGPGVSGAGHRPAPREEDLPELTLGDPEPERARPARASFEITAEIPATGPGVPIEQVVGAVPPVVDVPPAPPPLPVRVAPGGQIGRYQLLEQIGEGGMATIFRAKDSRNGRVVAVKALHAHQSQSLAGKRFQREFRAIHRLTHPNIVPVFEYGEEQGQPYIVMEYVAGHDLKHHLKILRAMPLETRWREVESLVGQICQALEFIHGRQIIHRDLKPSNILLTADNRAKLTDFGVAKPQDVSVQLTQAGMLVGTLAYLAPEVFEQAKIDHRIDLYALGVMLYVMLTDKLPFSGKSIAQIMQKHLKHAPDAPRAINPSVPEHLERICMRLLAKNPAERYQSAAEILRAIEQYRDAARQAAAHEHEGQGEQFWVPRLVGRAAALARVRDTVAQLVKGTGGLLIVEGAEGIGKSRLVESGLSLAGSQGLTVYAGRCLVGGQSWGEGFRAVVDAAAAELERTGGAPEALPRLRQRFGQDRPVPDALPEPRQDGLEEDLTALLLNLALKSPRIIWIDDLERADAGTLSGLAALSRKLVRIGAPLLIVATLQPSAGPPSPALQRLLSGESAGVRPQILKLEPLQTRDIAELLESMFPRDARVAPFAHRLFQETGGNPLAVIESLRLLVAQGRLGIRVINGERRWVMAMNVDEIRDRLQWPQGLRQLLLTRLAAYPIQTRTLLRLIAVWGRELRFKTLLRLASATEEAVAAHVDRLLADGWLAEDWVGGEEGYILAHPAYRTVLLSELTSVEQARLRAFMDLRLGLKKTS